MAQWACDLAPSCTGEIAILSATATATNQNAWIKDMETALKDPKFASLKLVDTVYGDDNPQTSTTQAQGLLQSHPNLKVIVAPTTVGILAAAKVVQSTSSSTVKVTGLGLPNDMKPFVQPTASSPVFGLWSVPDLGYLTYYVAAKLIYGEITGAEGETFTVPGLNGGHRTRSVRGRSSSSARPSCSTPPTSPTSTSRLVPRSRNAEAPEATPPGPRPFRSNTMERIGFTMRLLPGQEAEYRRRHAAVWPEMLAALRAAGARDYTIFIHGEDLFAYLEVDDFAASGVDGGERSTLVGRPRWPP